MKYAIFFAFAAFAFLAQADAKNVFDGLADRGAIANALKEKLTAAKEKLDEMIVKAQDALKEKLAEAREKAEHLIEELKEKAHEISDKVFVAAQDILDKMDATVNASLPFALQGSHDLQGIDDCLTMKHTIRMAAYSLIANTTACVTDRIDEAKSYLVDIYNLSTQSFDTIKEMQEESGACVKNVEGFKEITDAIGCVAEVVSAKGSLMIAKTIPAVIIDIADLVNEISTLQSTVPVCMSKNALMTLVEEAGVVAVSIKDCIREKLQHPTSTERISEEESNNGVVDKRPQVQPDSDNELSPVDDEDCESTELEEE